MAASALLDRIKNEGIEYVDLQFGDMFGMLQHTTFVASELDEDQLENGIPFDGSSIRAWKSIEKSDMIFKPDLSSAFVDPFREQKTLVIFGDIYEPRTGERYERAPRNIAHKALEYLKSLGIGDEIFFGPEPEFFIFDGVRYYIEPRGSYFEVDSQEGPWTTGEDGVNLGHKIRHKMGYFPATPQDTQMDLRSEIVTNMRNMGMTVYLHHHEVATSQGEIGIKFGNIITAGDLVHKYKYAVKNTAYKHGKTATFMPKPMFGDNGSGMHAHASIWKDGKNTFAGDGYANLSQTALYAIGGLLKHGRAIQAFTNPTGNSYRRLVPGYEAPVKLAYSATNRSAAIRIPYVTSDKARRFEFRCGDASGSPYLNFAAMTMAMIDGIKNKIDPGAALDKNIYDLPPEEAQSIPSTCATQEEAIREMLADKDWLTAGDVFDEEFIQAYAEFRLKSEVEPMKLQPTPLEYDLYYDC
ncbi:type I glutamate--ammonia ligase [Spirochaeta lutea]|uniref:Glutamine synthetase n=1 Tax=Spirochaeta lutea TaxID=1480694 RepID=A0A098R3S8_9SPIO|nr:type I glutamate--ammonia ligase [Spirochaeta lutea]KGE73357.1 glutamine synthetase [Spirochaeta lutea]